MEGLTRCCLPLALKRTNFISFSTQNDSSSLENLFHVCLTLSNNSIKIFTEAHTRITKVHRNWKISSIPTKSRYSHIIRSYTETKTIFPPQSRSIKLKSWFNISEMNINNFPIFYYEWKTDKKIWNEKEIFL